MKKVRRLFATISAAALLTVGAAAPASAQPPVITGGLVNITIVDVLNQNEVNVQVPVGVAANIAANVCVGNLQVGVLASQLARGGIVECTAETGDALVLQRVRNMQ
jgi:carbohydrate-selective porin OprB